MFWILVGFGSLWLIAPLIKALSPSDPCQAFPSLLSPSSLSSLSRYLPASLQPFTTLLPFFTYSVFHPSLTVCLHTLMSSFYSHAACGVYFRGKSPSPLEIQFFVYRILNQGTQKTDSTLNIATCKQLTESNAVYQQAAITQNWELNRVEQRSVIIRNCVNVSGLRINKVWWVASCKPVCYLLWLFSSTQIKFIYKML